MSSSYSDIFKKRQYLSTQLRSQVAIAWLSANGYKWIRRLDDRHFENIVRNPTIGCYVEVCALQHPGCVPLLSAAAKKMVWRECYF